MLGPAKPRRLDEPITVSLEDLVPANHFYRHREGEARLLDPLAFVGLEFRRVIDVRKRLIVRNRHAQERAQRLPPLLDVKDQQPVRGDRLMDCLIVLGKDRLDMRAVVGPVREGAGRG